MTGSRASAQFLIVQSCTSSYSSHMSTISASTARQTLPAQLDKVAKGEEVSITRHGEVVAVLVHPEVLRRRRNPEIWRKAAEVEEALASARGTVPTPGALTPERAEELVRGIDSDRDR